MWILEWLPNSVFYALFYTGIFGLLTSFVVTFIPFISSYKFPIQLISVIVIIFGAYMIGGISNEEKWKARIVEIEQKAINARLDSEKQNSKIIEKVVNKVEVVKTRGDDIIKYVDREVVKYDNSCVIPKEFIKAHNDAAEQPK
jgi:hypothetical protein